jgi:hypothetical protein
MKKTHPPPLDYLRAMLVKYAPECHAGGLEPKQKPQKVINI